MGIAEKLKKLGTAFKKKAAEKLKEKGKKLAFKETKGAAVDISWSEWLLIFLLYGYIGILFIILTVVLFIPVVGQIIYGIVAPILNFIAMGILAFWLHGKGLFGRYWILVSAAFIIGLAPFANWMSWIGALSAIYILYTLEKIPIVGKAVKKAEDAAITMLTKIK